MNYDEDKAELFLFSFIEKMQFRDFFEREFLQQLQRPPESKIKIFSDCSVRVLSA